ncbi:MAG: helix-turn-helix domain-containing protein [Burkholderiaceae bacterium]
MFLTLPQKSHAFMSLVVQKLRLQRGWSQQQLAELSGLSARTVQRIERGQNATAESLKILAAVFEVDFQELRTALEVPVATGIDAPHFKSPLLPETNMDPEPAFVAPQTATPPARSVRTMPSDEVRAFREVRRLRAFYIHLIQYLVVVGVLAIVNLWRNPSHLWVLWVAFGWGIGVVSHGLSIWQQDLLFGPDWERQRIEQRIGRKL